MNESNVTTIVIVAMICATVFLVCTLWHDYATHQVGHGEYDSRNPPGQVVDK